MGRRAEAYHCPGAPPSPLFLTSSFTSSRSFGSVGFPFDEGMLVCSMLIEREKGEKSFDALSSLC